MEREQIRAGNLLLRRWLSTDAEAVTRACQDPVLRHWTSSLPSPYTHQDGRQFVEDIAPQGWTDRSHLSFAVVDAGTGEFLASVAIHDPDGRPELGYWSAPWARGRRVTEPPTIDAGLIRLRPPVGRDLTDIVVAYQDPLIVRWFGVPQPYTEVDARRYVEQRAPQDWARGVEAVFVIADSADAYAGAVDLQVSATDPAVGEVGFLVAPRARGRGYATAAVRALAEWGFAELGLVRIQWRAEVGNHASRRVAEKAGFTMEGLVRQGHQQDGRRPDCWIASLLSSDRMPVTLSGSGGGE